MTDSTDRVRDGNGKYLRTTATAEREARAAALRSKGLSFQKVADQLKAEGLAPPGYAKGDAHADVQSAMQAVVKESAEEALAFSLRRLDEARERLHDARDRLTQQRDEILGLMGGTHVTVSHGKVVVDESTEAPIADDEFQLKAHDRLLRIEALLEANEGRLQANDESRRRLLGLDQPAKTQVSGGVTYEVVGIDPEALR